MKTEEQNNMSGMNQYMTSEPTILSTDTRTPDSIENPVQQVRPMETEDDITKPATEAELRESIEEINPDENTLDRG